MKLQLLKEHILEEVRLSLYHKEIQEAIDNIEGEIPPLDDENQPTNNQQPQNTQPEQSQQEPKNQQPEPVPNVPTVFSVTIEQALNIIRGSKGKFIVIEFTKRTDGTNRVLLGRLGVKKFLKGGHLPYDPWEKQVIPVFEVPKTQYRVIPYEGIISLKFNGIIYVVEANWKR